MLTRAKFDRYVKKGSVLHNYAHISNYSPDSGRRVITLTS